MAGQGLCQMKFMDYQPTTNVELVLRLTNTEDQQAWTEFVEIYEPLILRAARKLGLNSNDAVDATQEVLVHLSKVVSKWKPTGRSGSFRGWLVRVARNQMLKLVERTTMLRPQSGSADVQNLLSEDPEPEPDNSTYFNIEFRRQVFLHVVQKIRQCFNEKTWLAFWKTFIDQQPPQDVADELAISVGAVYIARSRVMNRLQLEVKNLVDDEWATLEIPDVNSPEDLSLKRIRNESLPEWQKDNN